MKLWTKSLLLMLVSGIPVLTGCKKDDLYVGDWNRTVTGFTIDEMGGIQTNTTQKYSIKSDGSYTFDADGVDAADANCVFVLRIAGTYTAGETSLTFDAQSGTVNITACPSAPILPSQEGQDIPITGDELNNRFDRTVGFEASDDNLTLRPDSDPEEVYGRS